MFCSTVMWAHRLKCWNTMASLVRTALQLLGDRRRCSSPFASARPVRRLRRHRNAACVGLFQQVDAAQEACFCPNRSCR
jgi:hypothetical protein